MWGTLDMSTTIRPLIIREKSYTLHLVSALAAFLLSGCDSSIKEDWETAPKSYSCTIEEMTKVQMESAWCSTNTAYFSNYCYGAAILRNCKAIPLKKASVCMNGQARWKADDGSMAGCPGAETN